MAFKFLILAVTIAAVHAGGPASYAISAPSLDHYSVGSSNEHTVKGLYGQNVLSTYSKAVDTPHSSVRVTNSKASNDIYGAHYGGLAPALHHGAAYPAAYHGGVYPGAYAGAYHGAAYPGAYHGALAAPLGGYHAPLAHAPLAYGHGYAAPLGVKAAVPVSSVSFHGLGAHYGW